MREGEREGGREGGREGERERGREGGREREGREKEVRSEEAREEIEPTNDPQGRKCFPSNCSVSVTALPGLVCRGLSLPAVERACKQRAKFNHRNHTHY